MIGGILEGAERLRRRGSQVAAEALVAEPTLQVAPMRALGGGAYVAATLYVVADLLHLWTVPERFEQWWGYGAFFLAVAVAEGIYGVALLRYRGDVLYLAGILVHLSAVAALYVVVRVVDPRYLGAWGVKPTGMLEASATAVETVAVLVLVMLLGGALRGKVLNALLGFGALASVLWLMGILP